MTTPLTPGRWRGLQTSSTSDHIFTILAFDQRGSYVEMLPPNTDYDTAARIKQEVIHALSPYFSAALLDPDYGIAAASKMQSGGLLLSVEKSGYSGDSTYRRTEFDPDWTIAKIKQVGASAVKLMVYYHPDSGSLAEELEALTARVIEECHAHDLPIFLEPMSYSLDKSVSKNSAAYASTRPQVVKDTAQRMSALKPDVLKLEFPIDAAFNDNHDEWRAACEAVSAVSNVPWVLLSAGVEFETFAQQARIACESGSSGYLAGRAIWKECVTMSPDGRAAFLADVAIPRIKQLNEIAAVARPMTAFYSLMPLSKGWYRA